MATISSTGENPYLDPAWVTENLASRALKGELEDSLTELEQVKSSWSGSATRGFNRVWLSLSSAWVLGLAYKNHGAPIVVKPPALQGVSDPLINLGILVARVAICGAVFVGVNYLAGTTKNGAGLLSTEALDEQIQDLREKCDGALDDLPADQKELYINFAKLIGQFGKAFEAECPSISRENKQACCEAALRALDALVESPLDSPDRGFLCAEVRPLYRILLKEPGKIDCPTPDFLFQKYVQMSEGVASGEMVDLFKEDEK